MGRGHARPAGAAARGSDSGVEFLGRGSEVLGVGRVNEPHAHHTYVVWARSTVSSPIGSEAKLRRKLIFGHYLA